jgi:chemotaxis protein histidine kinase CheA
LEAANQQRILGYFIEEAKEHLETLERGILELPIAVGDAERVNEMFRAAHSLKGGAAMLGYGSIQKTAHRLEDAFKILKEQQVSADQKLVSLFLAGYDILRELLEKLQSPFGLEDSTAAAIVERGEPIFQDLQDYLNQLLPEALAAQLSVISEPATLFQDLGQQSRELLRQMLRLFRGKDTSESRQQLREICQQLSRLAPQATAWQVLLGAVRGAIANPIHSYQTLAPIAIHDLKQGTDCLELGREDLIAPSEALQQLAAAQFPQLLVPLEPVALARALQQVLTSQQLSQLVQFLS